MDYFYSPKCQCQSCQAKRKALKRAKRIFRLRFPIRGESKGLTFEQIAAKEHISRQRVHQIIKGYASFVAEYLRKQAS